MSKRILIGYHVTISFFVKQEMKINGEVKVFNTPAQWTYFIKETDKETAKKRAVLKAKAKGNKPVTKVKAINAEALYETIK